MTVGAGGMWHPLGNPDGGALRVEPASWSSGLVRVGRCATLQHCLASGIPQRRVVPGPPRRTVDAVDRRRLVAPRWLALHAAVLVAVAGCALLGAWQLDRARDQRDQSVRPAGNSQLAPVEIDTVLPPGACSPWTTSAARSRIRGAYDADAQLVVPDRALDGRDGVARARPARDRRRLGGHRRPRLARRACSADRPHRRPARSW